ncbi:MAG: TonB-dependent receptor [Methyloprofundus sp.]|nr:TonB-dependent receptor [Methyloprofundus sp.]
MNRLKELIYCLTGCYAFAFYPAVLYAEKLDPTSLSIEQLMESEVTTASRTEQKFADTAAAVYVISQEDIQRAGVTNIPDVLRMAPGVQVARISASEWAVTIRGFNGRFANKLLVLLDGRTVYSPVFAGVRWENLDLVLEDIERIEVIRGPGASVWGQNAVNGVINIITKHTEDTQQGLVSIAAGNEERAIAELRYGDQLGDNAAYRVFGKFVYRDDFVDLQGNDAGDNWMQGRGGFRVDWNSNHGDRLMLEGDGFVSHINDEFLLPADDQLGEPRRELEEQSGASGLLHWDHDFSVASTIHTQVYYEYFNEVDRQFSSETSHTLDIDFQHDIALSKNNYFNWGMGYRYVNSAYFDGILSTTDPTYQDLHLVSAFVQDKALFFEGALQLTLGAKVQYYTLSDWDFQPSLRVLWKVHPEHRFWAAFSRATRSPSRGETALSLKPLALPAPVDLVFQANPDLTREVVHSYELGYRGWLSNQISLDMTLFYNDYKDLITVALGSVDYVNGQLPASFENDTDAQTWGGEMAAEWRPIERLRLQLSYSFLKVHVAQQEQGHNDPENQVSLRSSLDITSTITADLGVRYVDSFYVQSLLLGTESIVDSYVGLDLRFAWKPIHNLELSIVGQNLNNKVHLEYIDEVFAYPRQLERSFYGQIQWYFN